MINPYLVDDGKKVSCLCKGCGCVLWVRDHEGTHIRPTYGNLTIAMVDEAGVLSKHSTPACLECAQAMRDAPVSELEAWWAADVFHWFAESVIRGVPHSVAYDDTLRAAGGRRPVRVLSYSTDVR